MLLSNADEVILMEFLGTTVVLQNFISGPEGAVTHSEKENTMRIDKSLIATAGLAVALMATSALAANDPNFGQVMSSIQASKIGSTQIQGLSTVKSVSVVKVNDLAKGENIKALDAAVLKNQAEISSLRSAMTSNTAMQAALTKAKVDVSTVVAAEIASDGILTVYVR